MHLHRALSLTLLLSTALPGPVSLAAPTVRQAVPGSVQLGSVQLGSVQPIPPGYRKRADLPTLTLTPALPGVRKVEYLSNGFIEVTHVLIMVPATSNRSALALRLAQRAVAGTFTARPELAEIDVSVYVSGQYAGFGGPPPVFTASVPILRQSAFAQLQIRTLPSYDRAWLASFTLPIDISPAKTYEGPEVASTYVDPAKQVQIQRLAQALSAVGGSSLDNSVFYHGNPAGTQIALTFDDGVHPMYEPLILDVLRRTGAKATFFIVGRNALAYPYFVRDIAAQGHEVANHTYHHVRLPRLSDSQIRQELTSTDALLGRLTGQDIRFFRPPGGRFSARVLAGAKREGLTTAMWTDDPGDFNNIGRVKVENRLLSHIRPGGIVLLHENVPDTISVMTDFINDARASGYQLTTLAQMAGPK